MGKFFLLVILFMPFIAYAQAPVLVMADFETRARDVSADEASIIRDMFMDTLATNQSIRVIDRHTMTRTLAELEFVTTDWVNSTKTTMLAETLDAEYLLDGTIIQLGPTITFTLFFRDLRTLNVLGSLQKQYTVDNIWDGTNGLPAVLPSLASDMATTIATTHINFQAQRVAAQRAEDARLFQEGSSLIGTWAAGNWSITFNENGTFTANGGTHHSSTFFQRNNHAFTDEGTIETWTTVTARGTYTREENNIRLSWTRESSSRTMDHRQRLELDRWRGGFRRVGVIGEHTSSGSPSSGNVLYTIYFDSDINGSFVRIQRRDGNDFMNVATNGSNFRRR